MGRARKIENRLAMRYVFLYKTISRLQSTSSDSAIQTHFYLGLSQTIDNIIIVGRVFWLAISNEENIIPGWTRGDAQLCGLNR